MKFKTWQICCESLVVVAMAMALVAEAAPKNKSLKSEVDEIVMHLRGQIPKAKTSQEKLEKIQRSLAEITRLRSKAPRQNEKDEIYLEMLTGALKEIPKPEEFKEAQCSQYRNDIIKNYEPTAVQEPQDPPIREAYKILEEICPSKTGTKLSQ